MATSASGCLAGARLRDSSRCRMPRSLPGSTKRPAVTSCKIDLRALGITNYGEMKSRGFSRPTTPAHCELFFAGRPMTLARWPNQGAWEKLAGFPAVSGKNDDHGGNIGGLPGGFLYSGERPRHSRDTCAVWCHGFWPWDWVTLY